jgi:hypothetical protein
LNEDWFLNAIFKFLQAQIVMKTKNIICSFIRIVKPGEFVRKQADDYCKSINKSGKIILL